MEKEISESETNQDHSEEIKCTNCDGSKKLSDNKLVYECEDCGAWEYSSC